MANTYELMWNTLARRLEKGKAGWGKHELLVQMKEIEIGVWRGSYTPYDAESEKIADLELDKAINNGLLGSGLQAELSEADIQELEVGLDRNEEKV